MRPSCRAFRLKKSTSCQVLSKVKMSCLSAKEKYKLPSPVESENVANVTQIFLSNVDHII